MSDALQTLFGEGTDLNVWQMSARAAIVFVATLLMIRVAGRRSFGQHSAFDTCIAVLLGAILARAVVGASPLVATLCSALVLVLMHRLIGWSGVRWPGFERLVAGQERTLINAGARDDEEMQRALISDRDLREAMRKRFGDDDLQELEWAVLERDGQVSLKRKEGRG